MPNEQLSRAQARRVALVAQGFRDPRHTIPTMRTFSRTLERTGVLQVDSVNVLQRAHYMPLFSRMGPYDTDMLKRASEKKPRRMVEYWAHVQAFMPVDLWPVMQHRIKAAYAEPGAPPETVEELAAELRDLASWLKLDDIVVEPEGVLAAQDLGGRAPPTNPCSGSLGPNQFFSDSVTPALSCRDPSKHSPTRQALPSLPPIPS